MSAVFHVWNSSGLLLMNTNSLSLKKRQGHHFSEKSNIGLLSDGVQPFWKALPNFRTTVPQRSSPASTKTTWSRSCQAVQMLQNLVPCPTSSALAAFPVQVAEPKPPCEACSDTRVPMPPLTIWVVLRGKRCWDGSVCSRRAGAAARERGFTCLLDTAAGSIQFFPQPQHLLAVPALQCCPCQQRYSLCLQGRHFYNEG